jgi:hypothetical protein
LALTWIFTSDVIVRFADFPEMHGQAELKRLLVARVERQKNYRLKKRMSLFAPRMALGRMGVMVA